MRPGQTRLVWIETPANPTWDITDIAAAARIAHDARARLAVDSSVPSPVLTRPIAFGADLVVHSATKYLNGHSDVLAGAIVTKQEDGFWQRLRAWHRDGGAVLGPFEAWLLLRGMRTLFLRVERCSESALAIARHFEGHSLVSHVLYPGLPGHPGHAIAARQMSGGFGGMLSLRIRGGEPAAMAVAAAVRVIKRATSLGGVESLIEHRASIEGPSSPVPNDLLRLSVGIESPEDLIADLSQALDSAAALLEAAPPTAQAAPAPDDPPAATVESRLRELLDQRVRPMVQERGGDVTFVALRDGVLELGIVGSPGASVPLGTAIRNTVRHYYPEITEVRFAAANAGTAADSDGSTAEALQRLLDDWINPAVADHGGRIDLVKIENETAYLRLEGGCQGCAMADLTFRQGVEVMIKERVPGIVAVVDVTDHAAGKAPYFKTRKS
jgi:Fe-S cluster biogenesis protein NfuA